MSVTSVDTDYDNLATFESREDMERVVSIGTVEGLPQAVSQMDGVLDS